MESETVRHCLSWEELRDTLKANAFERLGRLPEQLAIYRQHTQVMRREFVTVGDYILHHHFGFTCHTRPEDGRKYVEAPLEDPQLQQQQQQQQQQQRQETTTNNSAEHEEHFAQASQWYDIGHFLLWSLKPIEPQHRLEQIIRGHVATDEEFVYFVNPPELQSVHNVCHVHVLVHRQQRRTEFV